MRAVEALRVDTKTMFDARAPHLDVMDRVAPAFRTMYTDLYLGIVEQHREAWAALYRIMDRTLPSAPLVRLRRAIERFGTHALRKAIAAFAPDAVICTHFLPA